MKLVIEQSADQAEPEIIVRCGLIDPRLEQLIAQLRLFCFSIVAKRDGESRLVALEEVFYFESVDDTTFLYRERDVFACDLKLWELEQQLAGTDFQRISKSCILNLQHLDRVRPLLDGRFAAILANGEQLTVNRHYVKAFKQKFGL